MSYIKLAKMDLSVAKNILDVYRDTKEKEAKNIAAFHIQQAIEKLIKVQIYNSGVNYNNYKIYTHNIRQLIKYATEELGIDIGVPKLIKDNALLITDWAVEGRYDIHFTINIRTLENTYNETYCWYTELQEKSKKLKWKF